MAGIWGKNIGYSIFGESHGAAIGIVIDKLPPGIFLDLDFIQEELNRRAPGKNGMSTTRVESDEFEILSGFFNGRTTGAPLCAIIRNNSQHSKDYDVLKDVMRPGHADLTGKIKYSGFNDYRGGGHFSGRITAPLVFAGAVAKQVLELKDIIVGSHILSISSVKDDNFSPTNISMDLLSALRLKELPVIDDEAGSKMKDEILNAKLELDSVGGVVETAVINLPVGVGEPFFDSLESNIAHLIFSIPAVKGIEFGLGFEIANYKGSEANDEFYFEGENIKTRTNNNGGILGGISTGMPVIFRAAFKPTPSIGKEQNTINYTTMEETKLRIHGRHDPCIVQRAVPVVESVTAMAVLELLSKE